MAQSGYTPILIYSSSTGGNTPTAGNLTNSTLGSELAINIADGKLFYKDSGGSVQVIGWKTVPTTAGGTGLTSYSAGDLIYYASGSAFTKLAIGSSGNYLSSSGTAPQWTAPAALTKTDDTNVTLTLGGSASTALLNAASITVGWSGTLAATRGGTGIGSYAVGDLLYADTTTSLAKLADVATGNALISGGVGVAPSWGKIGLTTHVSGTLAVGNGGTGVTTIPTNRVPYGNGTGAILTSGNLEFDGTNLGIGEAPISGYRVAVDGDAWFGNTGGVVIGTISNDGGWFAYAGSVNVNGVIIKSSAEVKTTIGTTDITRTQAGVFFPASNNAVQLGQAGFRWSEVFAVNGTINTSDERLKEQVQTLTDAEKNVAARLKSLIRTYKFKDAVAKKGDKARIHIGVMAQQVKAAFAAEGLDAENYGIFCYDEWPDEFEDEFEKQVIENDDGTQNEIWVKTGNKKLVREAGNLYGIRYEQLLAFVVAAI